MIRRRGKEAQVPVQEKILDVTANMQGEITFKDPVNLQIQGTFEGTLRTKGKLTIGQTAQVKAEIEGDTMTIAGKVKLRVSKPPSTSRVTVALPSATLTLEAKVACGQPNNAANI